MGGTVAARAILNLPDTLFAESDFRPTARIREASVIATFASACIDTSDALIAALDQLARLNGVGFDIDAPLDRLIDPRALDDLGGDVRAYLAALIDLVRAA